MKKGFTLSEVLITLVVIGIVAAFTILSLINYTNDIELKSKAKKTYSMLSGAMAMTSLNGFSTSLTFKNSGDAEIKAMYDKYLSKNLAIMKTCYNTAGCWNSGHTYYLKGGTVYYSTYGIGVGANIITAVLNDGTFINLDSYGTASMKNYFGVDVSPAGLVVFFDVNGAKKPNKMGKDVYVAVYRDDTLVPAYADYPEKADKDCSSKGTGYACLYKLVEKGSNMID
ncbi:MAG: type II secretion system protein [Candidatus Gastranaerophilales bacterium]|nr:type II secretion system protein [Candidatus Gastranaerophilales bacterium]